VRAQLIPDAQERKARSGLALLELLACRQCGVDVVLAEIADGRFTLAERDATTGTHVLVRGARRTPCLAPVAHGGGWALHWARCRSLTDGHRRDAELLIAGRMPATPGADLFCAGFGDEAD